MNNTVKHEGIVECIEQGTAFVKIIQQTACSGCHVKSACTVADQSEKIIEAICPDPDVHAGDVVWIVGSEAMSRKALRLAVFYPFISLFGVLCIAFALSVDELWSGIIALASLIPYYIMLYFRKDKIRKDFVFTIERKES